jgi:hypothetical protein
LPSARVYATEKDGGWWVRPAAMFVEIVATEDGPQPRFEHLPG